MKETIFIAKPTEKIAEIYLEYCELYKELDAALKVFHEVKTLDLSDIWVRDFLPVQNIRDRSLHTLFYDPTYKRAQYKEWYALLREETKKHFPQAQATNIRMDGGNLIFNGKGVALALKKNSIVMNTSYEELSVALKKSLGLEEVIWLPNLHDSYDPFVHIDGFMQFLGDDILLTNKPCDKYAAKYLSKCQRIIKAKYPEIKIVELPLWTASDDKFGAKGIYVNFLETSKAVFVPQYNLPQDEGAVTIIKSVTEKPVIGIDCEVISRHGGSLHCLTNSFFM